MERKDTIMKITTTGLTVIGCFLSAILMVSSASANETAQNSVQGISQENNILDDRTEEINAYLSLYSGDDLVTQKKQTEALAWLGLTDVRVYDALEKRLKEIYTDSTTDRLINDSISWFMKGLSYSGNPKYKTTLAEIKESTEFFKHKKYAGQALDYLDLYADWNPIINAKDDWNPEESGKVNRYANMIRSEVLKLKEMAAKRIYGESIKNPYLLSVVEKELLLHCTDRDRSSRFGTTYGFMSKALGASGVPEYGETVKKVYDCAVNKKLKRLAKKHIKEFDLK